MVDLVRFFGRDQSFLFWLASQCHFCIFLSIVILFPLSGIPFTLKFQHSSKKRFERKEIYISLCNSFTEEKRKTFQNSVLNKHGSKSTPYTYLYIFSQLPGSLDFSIYLYLFYKINYFKYNFWAKSFCSCCFGHRKKKVGAYLYFIKHSTLLIYLPLCMKHLPPIHRPVQSGHAVHHYIIGLYLMIR